MACSFSAQKLTKSEPCLKKKKGWGWGGRHYRTALIGVFFLATRIFGEGFGDAFSACAFLFLFFISGDQLAHTNSTLYARIGPQWFSELRRLWPSVPRRVACELVSLRGFALCLQSVVSPLRHSWVRGVCVLMCNMPPALLAELPVVVFFYIYHCGNTGVERTPNKRQHRKFILEKKLLPPILPGFELAPFRSQVRRSYQQAIPTPRTAWMQSGDLTEDAFHYLPTGLSVPRRTVGVSRRKGSALCVYERSESRRYPQNQNNSLCEL